jgi:hypothetical protein
MGTEQRVTLTFLVCCALSAAVALPARHYLLGAFVGCGISLGCTDELTAVAHLSAAALLIPFAIFAAGAHVVSRALKAAAVPKAERFGIAAAFTLLPPVLLLWQLLR